jgi:hypothetical protein
MSSGGIIAMNDQREDAISPDHFVDGVLGYLKTAALKGAVALDLFSAIAETDGTAESIAARVQASPRGVRILCDFLTVHGFLRKEGQHYRLAPSTATFLTRSSPAWLGSVVDFLAAPEFMRLWLDDPVSYVRNGGSVGLANTAPDNPLWVTFARAMVPFMAAPAEALAAEVRGWSPPVRRVADISAGHGLYGIAIGKAVPGAEIIAVDWAPVLKLAEANAAAAGLGGRYRLRPGSTFDVDWGSDFDLIMLPSFLHHFDRDACVALLAKARHSLAEKGRVVVAEYVVNEDRISPPFPAMFAFIMLGSTPSGDAYTERQLEEMGRAAGFTHASFRPLPPTPHTFVTYDRS